MTTTTGGGARPPPRPRGQLTYGYYDCCVVPRTARGGMIGYDTYRIIIIYPIYADACSYVRRIIMAVGPRNFRDGKAHGSS